MTDLGGKPATAVFTLVRGDQWTRVLTFKERNEDGDLVPIPLTGYEIAAKVVKELGQDEVFSPNVSIVDADAGQAQVDITETMSLLLRTSKGDLQNTHYLVVSWTPPDDVKRTLAHIKMTVLPGG